MFQCESFSRKRCNRGFTISINNWDQWLLILVEVLVRKAHEKVMTLFHSLGYSEKF